MSAFVHPAIRRLVVMQTLARWRRLGRGFTTPRRFILSAVGLLLGVFYLGNVVVSVCLREPMDAERFRTIVPLGLMAYVVWDLVKAACRRPPAGLVWTRAERERLLAAPFAHRDILAYRLAGVLLAAIAKALLFSIVMFVDIPIYGCGICGVLLALIFVDLLRMLVSLTAFGLSAAAYNVCRGLILVMAGGIVLSAVSLAWSKLDTNANAASGSIKLVMNVGRAFMELGQTVPGQILATPFMIYTRIVSTDRISLALWTDILTGVSFVVGVAWLVIRLDAYFVATQKLAERRRFVSTGPVRQTMDKRSLEIGSLQIRVQRGFAILVWRQLLGAKRYWASVLVAMAPPAVLSCLPLMVNRHSADAFYAVVGSLAFYSFVLLPSALKFDFRRDFYRMVVLKSLPIRPDSVVLGQLACPVLMTSLFQLVMVGLAATMTRGSLSHFVAAMLILVPLNVLIFALDNLIFLLYPHPMKQEGFETFLRTTLTFTAKGLFFAGAWAR